MERTPNFFVKCNARISINRLNSINISTKSKRAPWKCTLCEKTWHKDEINFQAFTAHHDECLKKRNKRYKNQEVRNVKKIEGKK